MKKIRKTWQLLQTVMKERGLLLTLALPTCGCIVFPQSCSYSWKLKNPNLFCVYSHLRCSSFNTTTIRWLKWDAVVEKARSRKLGFSFRGNNGNQYDDDEDDDIYGDAGSWGMKRIKKRRKRRRRWWSDQLELVEEMGDESSGILDQVIDNVWIFKVFKSFGWMLPFVLISLILATGPKAFLMALAVAIGLSALILAFEKLMGKEKRKARMRRKPSSGTTNTYGTEEKQEKGQETRKRKMGNQSWVGRNNGSADNGTPNAPNFGGWDELDSMAPICEPSQTADGTRRTPVEKGKLSERERNSGTPLLLRLLIALFPFLGSWTRFL